EILARSYSSQIVRRWKRFVSADLFRVYFFDNLATDAAGLRHSIISFLGANPDKPSEDLPPEHNAKAAKQKLSLTQTARECLARFFESELRECAAELGGPAAPWPQRYGL